MRYIRYNKKIRYIQIFPNRFSIDWVCSGQFETLIKVHKRMRSSDATCCASMAVKTCFFSTCEVPPSNMASRSPKTWCITHFHVLDWKPPSLGLDDYTHTFNFILKNVKNR